MCEVYFDEDGYQPSDYFNTVSLEKIDGKWTFTMTRLPNESLHRWELRKISLDHAIKHFQRSLHSTMQHFTPLTAERSQTAS